MRRTPEASWPTRGVPLGHVHFFHIEHGDIWARDMGPQFTRSSSGGCASTTGTSTCGGTRSRRATLSTLEEAVRPHRGRRIIDVPMLDAQAGPEHGRAHDPRGRQRDAQRPRHDDRRRIRRHPAEPGAGPVLRRAGAGDRLRAAEHLRAEPGLAGLPGSSWRDEYRRMLGVRKVIWIPDRRRRGQRDVPRSARRRTPRTESRRHRHPAHRRLHGCSPPTGTRTRSSGSCPPKGRPGTGDAAGCPRRDARRADAPLVSGAEPPAARARLRHPLGGRRPSPASRSRSCESPCRS